MNQYHYSCSCLSCLIPWHQSSSFDQHPFIIFQVGEWMDTNKVSNGESRHTNQCIIMFQRVIPKSSFCVIHTTNDTMNYITKNKSFLTISLSTMSATAVTIFIFLQKMLASPNESKRTFFYLLLTIAIFFSRPSFLFRPFRHRPLSANNIGHREYNPDHGRDNSRAATITGRCPDQSGRWKRCWTNHSITEKDVCSPGPRSFYLLPFILKLQSQLKLILLTIRLARFEKTNEMLVNCNHLSNVRFEKASKDLKSHITTLVEVKKDLDSVYKRIKVLRNKLTILHPEAFTGTSIFWYIWKNFISNHCHCHL